MPLSELTAISPLDGRYRNRLDHLGSIASELGLQRYRVQVEIEWFIALASEPAITDLSGLSPEQTDRLRAVVSGFGPEEAEQVRELERTTNHDVKAIEYFVKAAIDHAGLAKHREFVHFACTSEDINNTAYGLMLTDLTSVLLERVDAFLATLDELAASWSGQAMLARTHGQAASPTTMGKEIGNVAARLRRQRNRLASQEMLGKFNGAVGNYNAHLSAYPDVDWPALSQRFLAGLGLMQNPMTTQIEPHDYVAETLDTVRRICQIQIDFSRDVWSYIAIGYFSQRKVEGETGSSTMPHKVNPIDFENAEGNLGVSAALAAHLADKLPISRWQRDLSDSTVLRNLGVVFGHAVLAGLSLEKGLSKLSLNPQRLSEDLDGSWEVLAEPVQTVMRRFGIAEPYERLKAATRGEQLDADGYQRLLDELALPTEADALLRDLTPARYTGLAAALANELPVGSPQQR